MKCSSAHAGTLRGDIKRIRVVGREDPSGAECARDDFVLQVLQRAPDDRLSCASGGSPSCRHQEQLDYGDRRPTGSCSPQSYWLETSVAVSGGTKMMHAEARQVETWLAAEGNLIANADAASRVAGRRGRIKRGDTGEVKKYSLVLSVSRRPRWRRATMASVCRSMRRLGQPARARNAASRVATSVLSTMAKTWGCYMDNRVWTRCSTDL